MRVAVARPASAMGWLVVAIGGLMVVLILYPLVSMGLGAFVVNGEVRLDAFANLVFEPGMGDLVWNTLVYVGSSALLALLLGGTLAWLLERTDADLGFAARIVPLVPLLMPQLAVTIGWVILLAPRTGLINNVLRTLSGSSERLGPLDIYTMAGMIFVTAIILSPYAYLTISAALRNVDASLEEASRMSGAGLAKTLRRISFPIVTPAIISATALILMIGLTLFSVPGVIGPTARVDVLATLMFRMVKFDYPPRIAEVVALSIVLLAVIQVLLITQWLSSSRRYQTVGAQGLRRSRVRLGRLRFPAIALVLAYFLASSVLPVIALVTVSLQPFWSANLDPGNMSFANYEQLIWDSEITDALRNSLLLGLGAAIVVIGAATLMSYYGTRVRRSASKAIEVITTLPVTIPHIILGVAFLIAFSRPPLVLYGSIALLFLAYLVLYIPQAMQTSRFAFTQISPELAEASRVFGANEGRTFRRVLLPLLFPSIFAGILIVTVLASTEVNTSLMLMTVDSRVTGPTMYSLWTNGLVPEVAAFSVVVCLVNVVVASVATYVGGSFTRDRTA